MLPQPHLAIVGIIHHATSGLLTTSAPGFLRLGYSMFVASETIRIVWHGIRVILGDESLGDNVLGFAELLLFIAFGYAIVACCESPIGAITCGT